MAGRTATKMESVLSATSGALADATFGTHQEWLYAIIDLSTDASTTVYTGPVIVGGVYVSTVMSAHAIALEDGSTSVFTIAASTAANTTINFLGGTRFNTSLVVNPNDSSTGVIVVLYRPL